MSRHQEPALTLWPAATVETGGRVNLPRAVVGKAKHRRPADGTPAPAGTPDRPCAVVVAGAVAVAVLDTTAQPPQSAPTDTAADILKRRAKSKARTEAVVEGLAALGTRTPLRMAYANTLACTATLRQDGATIRGKYCGNRWCAVCNRIRTAKLRQAYAPILAAWSDAHFVTLTIPNMGPRALPGAIRQLLKNTKLLADQIRRTDKLPWKAVRKLEVTYNVGRRDFHPHLHLIVKGAAQARALVARHLAKYPDANAGAQHIAPCVGANAMAELFKYLTKQTVKDDKGRISATPPAALDIIYKAVRRLRTIQPMGFSVAVEQVTPEDEAITLDASTPAPLRMEQPTDWTWYSNVTDWVNLGTGELLSGYSPDVKEKRLLANIRRHNETCLAEPPPLRDLG